MSGDGLAADGVIAIPGESNILRIAVKNTTAYAARSPAVVIEFRDCALRQDMYAAVDGWTATEHSRRVRDVIALQWDGGPNYAIHGRSTWWQVGQKVRNASLTPGQLASPLMRRPRIPSSQSVPLHLVSYDGGPPLG